jgi:hypothetical protein
MGSTLQLKRIVPTSRRYKVIPKQIDQPFGRSDMGRTKPPGASRKIWLAHEITGQTDQVLGGYDNAGEIDRTRSRRPHSQRVPSRQIDFLIHSELQ